MQIEIHIFIVRSWSGEVMNRAPDEHDALEWFASGELDALTVADPDLIEASRAALAARPNNGSAA